MRLQEKCFSKCKGSYKNKYLLRKRFSEAQKDFDKKLRFFERQYKQNKVEQIDNLNTNNSAKFWDQASRLGPKKQTVIPMKVQTEDGISFEQEVIPKNGKMILAVYIILNWI